MKKISILLTLAWLFSLPTFAQDQEGKTAKENKNKSLLGYWVANESSPERFIYENGYLVDNQTSVIPSAKSLEMMIQHRFGSMDNGISDLYGIYGPGANSRMGLNYSITDWLQVAYGISKQNMVSDIGLKINLIQQSRDKKIPVSVTYYHNFAIEGNSDNSYGINYKFTNRFSFFNEVLVTRKFCDWFTLSVGGSFTHFNMADSLYEHDKIALHFLGRIKLSQQSSILIDCDLPLNIDGIKEWPGEIKDPPKPNFGIGWEIATMTHAFQLMVGTSTFMVPQYNVMYNQNDFFKGDIFVGFNITRLWNF
jgi:hypothetical protein